MGPLRLLSMEALQLASCGSLVSEQACYGLPCCIMGCMCPVWHARLHAHICWQVHPVFGASYLSSPFLSCSARLHYAVTIAAASAVVLTGLRCRALAAWQYFFDFLERILAAEPEPAQKARVWIQEGEDMRHIQFASDPAGTLSSS